MRIYIIDDDPNIVRIIEDIIEEEKLGDVIGTAFDGQTGLNEVILEKPDIVLVDLLMPNIDGIKLVQDAFNHGLASSFIMISQVSIKPMIGKAYNAGVEFFIAKPINRIEVSNVIRNLSEKLEMKRKFSVIESMFTGETSHDQRRNTSSMDNEAQKIKIIFSKIGIMGEKGCDDILKICHYTLEHNSDIGDFRIKEICDICSDNPKATEQRIRRAINKGLVNIANLGIEDYMNDIFIRYSSTLYDFENVKAEMDYIRGKRTSGGKINVRRFIENLLLRIESQ